MHVTGTIHDTPVVTKTWSNGAHRLYSDPQELISSNFISDANPLSEGFILMNNQKKTSTTNKIYTSSSNKSNNTKTLNSKATALVAYIKPSMNAKMTLSKTLFNASTTTCRPDPLTLKSTLSTLTYQKTTMLTDQLKNEYQLPTVTVTARRIIGEITVQSAYDNTSYTQDKKTLRTNETEQLDVMAEAFRVADPELMPFDSPEDKIADGSGDYNETSPQSTSTSTTSTSTSAPPGTMIFIVGVRDSKCGTDHSATSETEISRLHP
ncbi:unnamed protein product [Didymodactylos carnosus]|uniref:Uncharacterized protein n=1 Tax=Didymodactylos carnosus TaxID=1234261 RepID=A0A813ZN27_9BILA|nr:unnamed protein product [Didymodactylos carnosus]CAF3683249.1 unnamed protein product [Didymodactylos carnosus]